MARLDAHDYEILIGADWRKRIEPVNTKTANTEEEKDEARSRRFHALGEMRFSLTFFIGTGLALAAGSLYRHAGFDLQAQIGSGVAALASISFAGLGIARRKIGGDA